jgi:hypothetical protein
MFIYNVTVKVNDSIKNEWLQWLKNEHIPEVIATDCFSKATILRLMDIDEAEGPTYAIQYFAESKSAYNQYIDKYAGILRQKSIDKWRDQFIAFRSFMQIVD